MTPDRNTAPESDFEFTLPERWALHSAVAAHVEDALDGDTVLPYPAVELAVLDRIEAGEYGFTAFERERLAALLDRYAARDATPERDEAPAVAVAERLDGRCPTEHPR